MRFPERGDRQQVELQLALSILSMRFGSAGLTAFKRETSFNSLYEIP